MLFSLIPPLVQGCEPLLVVLSASIPLLSLLHPCFFPIINILSLSLFNSGDQSPDTMATKPPMQVHVCVMFPFCVLFLYSNCTCFLPVRALRPLVVLLSCTALLFRVALTAVESRCSHLPHLASSQLCAE